MGGGVKVKAGDGGLEGGCQVRRGGRHCRIRRRPLPRGIEQGRGMVKPRIGHICNERRGDRVYAGRVCGMLVLMRRPRQLTMIAVDVPKVWPRRRQRGRPGDTSRRQKGLRHQRPRRAIGRATDVDVVETIFAWRRRRLSLDALCRAVVEQRVSSTVHQSELFAARTKALCATSFQMCPQHKRKGRVRQRTSAPRRSSTGS